MNDWMEMETGTLNLEKMQVACQHWIDEFALENLEDVPGLDLRMRLIEDVASRGIIVEIRGYVLAAKRDEEPVEVDHKERRIKVPLRPVRDGVWLWLHAIAPWPGIERWLWRRVQWRSIVIEEHSYLQHVHYYGCPHLPIKTDKQSINTHFQWLARKSEQFPSEPT